MGGGGGVCALFVNSICGWVIVIFVFCYLGSAYFAGEVLDIHILQHCTNWKEKIGGKNEGFLPQQKEGGMENVFLSITKKFS